MEKNLPLILITRTKYILDLENPKYVVLKNSQTTIPLGNTDILSPDNSEIETDVLAVAIIELTEDPHGPATIAFLTPDADMMDDYLNGITDFPPVALSMMRNATLALDYIIDYADSWLASHGVISENIEDSNIIIVNDIRKGDSKASEDIQIDLDIIHEGSFDVTFTFLHSTLVYLLSRYSHRERVIKSATHETTHDVLN